MIWPKASNFRAVARCIQGLVAGIALVLGAPAAYGATVDVRCPGMPLAVEEDLFARASRLLTDAGMPWASIGLQCDATGAWLVWMDGSRAPIDQGRGIVQGALDLIQSRLAADRYAATPPAAYPAPEPPTEIEPVAPPRDEVTQRVEPAERKNRTEGGVGLATVAQIWSGSSAIGFGPRLDVSVGPPGKFAVLLSEDALFGTGSKGSGAVVFDFQVGAAYGAPFKMRTGFGVVAMIGAERASASNDNASNGLAMWAFTGDLGVRASLPSQAANFWLGADVLFRSDDFETGEPSPVVIRNGSFVLSLGCFFPALVH
jgi:hypothetical protein